ncbi:unnamed protein product, partial [Nesidiocoris tenuis]
IQTHNQTQTHKSSSQSQSHFHLKPLRLKRMHTQTQTPTQTQTHTQNRIQTVSAVTPSSAHSHWEKKENKEIRIKKTLNRHVHVLFTLFTDLDRDRRISCVAAGDFDSAAHVDRVKPTDQNQLVLQDYLSTTWTGVWSSRPSRPSFDITSRRRSPCHLGHASVTRRVRGMSAQEMKRWIYREWDHLGVAKQQWTAVEHGRQQLWSELKFRLEDNGPPTSATIGGSHGHPSAYVARRELKCDN